MLHILYLNSYKVSNKCSTHIKINVIKSMYSHKIDLHAFQFEQYKMRSARRVKEGVNLKFQLGDTMGLMENGGMPVSDVAYLLEGKVPNGYQVSLYK